MQAAVSPSPTTTRRERIVTLLEHLPDFTETLYRGGEGSGSPNGPGLMPKMYSHPSVVELFRCIEELRQRAPVGCAHMLAYYSAEWRIAGEPLTVRKHGKTRQLRDGEGKLVYKRMRERVVPAWVRRQKVKLATDIVVGLYQGEPYLPTELLAA